MANYSRHEAPGFPDKPTEVKLGFYGFELQYLSEDNSDFLVSFQLMHKWKDPRLSFPTTSAGITGTIPFPEGCWKQIWVPDIYIVSATDAKMVDDKATNRYMKAYPDGQVWYVAKMTAVIPSHFDFSNYPFDKHRLDIKFESFGRGTDVLSFTALEVDRPVEIDWGHLLRQFSISNGHVYDCTFPGLYPAIPCLGLAFGLERRSYQFVLQFYLPSSLVVILSWLAFWIELETSSPIRPLTGILSFIALILLEAFAGTSKVTTNYRTFFNCWMTACYVFLFATLVEFAVVNILSRKRSSARGYESLKLPFAGAEKAVEANGKKVDGGEGGGNRKARLVDWFSRILFPIAFLIFNLIYWILVIALVDDRHNFDLFNVKV